MGISDIKMIKSDACTIFSQGTIIGMREAKKQLKT